MRRSLVLLLFIPALAACSGGADQAEPVEVTLEAKEFGFSPGTIEGTAG